MVHQAIIDNYESENENQVKAITHPIGTNLIIIAGPGTGKTRVITKRISHLINNENVSPDSILIVTFTNRAIDEIMRRIKNESLFVRKICYTGTLHSISRKMLIKFKDSLSLINISPKIKINVIDEYHVNDFLSKWWREKDAKKMYSKIPIKTKNIIINYIQHTKIYSYTRWNKYKIQTFTHTLYGGEGNLRSEELEEVFVAYNKYLIEQQKFDFDDLLILFHNLLITEATGVREWCQKSFSQILVDEFQDMNELQLEIIKEISGKNYNVCCVGDPNQAIYGFQGAYPKIFSDFKDMHPNNTTEIYLNENYRSTKKILDLSNKLIAYNKPENEVNVYTEQNPEGENIITYTVQLKKPYKPTTTKNTQYLTFEEQIENNNNVHKQNMKKCKWLIDKLNELKEQGVKFKDIAVLYRVKTISEVFKRAFSSIGIQIIDYVSCKHIQDEDTQAVICYLSLCFDDDSFSVKFLLNFYAREEKITNTTIEGLINLSEKYGGSWYSALFNMHEIKLLDTQDKEFLQKICNLIIRLKDIVGPFELDPLYFVEGKNIHLYKVLALIKKEFGNNFVMYCQYSIYMFFYSLVGIWHFVNTRYKSIREFAKYMLLYVKYFQVEQEDFCINFSTIHSSKGCEFEHVFLLGVTENIMPIFYATDKTQNKLAIIKSTVEEERRVMYVGITRAKKCLYLVHQESEDIQKNIESQFLTELKNNASIDYLTEITQEIDMDENTNDSFVEDVGLV